METYDLLPINLLEMQGKIERKSFRFIADNYKIWQNGHCIKDENKKFIIDAVVTDRIINVKIENSVFGNYIVDTMSFKEISLNRDRILWSNDLFRGGYNASLKEASFMSLFYCSGILSKVAFSVNSPSVILEFILNQQGKKMDYENPLKKIANEILYELIIN
jgi:hypothetical protein